MHPNEGHRFARPGPCYLEIKITDDVFVLRSRKFSIGLLKIQNLNSHWVGPQQSPRRCAFSSEPYEIMFQHVRARMNIVIRGAPSLRTFT
jgi:hypothetical protein